MVEQEEENAEWFDDFLGVAYRFFDVRMNVCPVFSTRKFATKLWFDTIHWWADISIKMRFVEYKDQYWFITAGPSRYEESNRYFFKVLPRSEHYERFKKNSGGEAYLRFAVLKDKDKNHKEKQDGAEDSAANQENAADEDKQEKGDYGLELLKRKKTVSDIKFLSETEVKQDSLSWNCLYHNKFKNS